ncbi:Gfo/Idh/MocA family oxidoreductase [Bacillaceae bacterium SIJ1]|uniref:Gfo/Idh/MocA family protein n=1 Tax=Litoribacterium kuwaitense TaxID=1398745 RepID=UPI0013EBE245|nr:Gfo/Idh/MocA family oxidoreductase [Litoribacterium kuwaitense]NGP46138.1 Gfo/Idh/MocA family oxidoreductase [Litoribacterium kuwaitense]
MTNVKVGVVGCGVISKIYLENSKKFAGFDIVACADLDMAKAQSVAETYEIRSLTVEEIVKDNEIDLILNLTIPAAHADVALAALENGKHVYGEKPLAVTREDGRKILDKAKETGLKVGSAPDTFLGGGLQTSRKLIDDGWIGRPIGATAFMMSGGPESWHPQPDFLYKHGAGPLFDMGPYYLTTYVNLFGPVKRVTGMTTKAHEERLITSQPRAGEKITVETPTSIYGLLEFEAGLVGSLLTSFDIAGDSTLPRIEVYGTEGTLILPDPNTFGGPVKIKRVGSKDWAEVPLTHGFAENSRGIGLADMAFAILHDRAHRANGDLAYHVLDLMHSFGEASDSGQHVTLQSTVERPAAFPPALQFENLREKLSNE